MDAHRHSVPDLARDQGLDGRRARHRDGSPVDLRRRLPGPGGRARARRRPRRHAVARAGQAPGQGRRVGEQRPAAHRGDPRTGPPHAGGRGGSLLHPRARVTGGAPMFVLDQLLPDSPLIDVARAAVPDVLRAIQGVEALVAVTPLTVDAVLDAALHAGFSEDEVEGEDAPDPATDEEMEWDTVDAAEEPRPDDSAEDGETEAAFGLHVDASVLDPLVIPIPGLEVASLV